MSAVATWLLSVPAIALAQPQIAIGEYAVPTFNSNPFGITTGPDGALWFTEYSFSGNKIGRITTTGAIIEYAVPTGNSGPEGITAGPDGALWFTESDANKIGRSTTAGSITEYPVPTAGSGPKGITPGPDGALWFTEYLANSIGRITTAGAITEYPVPTGGSGPMGITPGPDGALWFTESLANSIGRITTAGAITEYPVPTTNSYPDGITAGPDGALWFTEYVSNKIGRITTAGAIIEYTVPTGNSGLIGITAGPDGALWFTEYSFTANKIGRITTAGAITEYAVPSVFGGPYGITSGPDGALWFAEDSDDKIGQALFVTASLSVSPVKGFYQSKLTFSGRMFGPNESVQIYVGGVGSAVLARATADSSGSFTVTAHAPQGAYGPRLFLSVGQSSGKLGAASFSVNPRLVLNPTSGTVGSTVTARGYGFGSLEYVTVSWKTPSTLLGAAAADVHGTFSGSSAVTFTVPTGAPVGANTVVGRGKPSADATFTVR